MTCLSVTLAGERLVLDGRGGVYWPEHRLLIVADLHLQKGQALAAAGSLLPPYDTRATLARLVALLSDHRPDTVLSLGDGFHRADGYGALATEDRQQLDAIAAVCRWRWLAGNHDPDAPPEHGEGVRGPLRIGGLTLRHAPGASTDPGGEMMGHLHPRAVVRVRGRRVVRPCFVIDGRRLLLPALGAFTGGLDVWNAAIAGLFAASFDVVVCGRDGRLRRLPAARLEGAPRRHRSPKNVGR